MVSKLQSWHFCQTGHFYSGMTYFTLTINRCISNIPLFFNAFRQSFKNYPIAKRIYELDSSINMLSHSSSNCSPAFHFLTKSVYCTRIYHRTVPISDKVWRIYHSFTRTQKYILLMLQSIKHYKNYIPYLYALQQISFKNR